MKNSIVGLLLFVCMGAWAQEEDKALVKEAMAPLNVMEPPAKGQVYELLYHQRIAYWDKSMKPQQVSVLLLANAQQVLFQSDEVGYYMDNQDAFVVLSDQHKIIWMNSAKEVWQQQDFSKLGLLKEQLYASASYERISTKGEKEDLIWIKITPKEELAPKIDYLLVEIDLKTKKLVRLLQQFKQGYTAEKRIEFIFEKINYDSKYRFPRNVRQLIFNGKKLQQNYLGYQIVDIRK